jgi:hypothetical protein
VGRDRTDVARYVMGMTTATAQVLQAGSFGSEVVTFHVDADVNLDSYVDANYPTAGGYRFMDIFAADQPDWTASALTRRNFPGVF